jgi:hypothetical protein
MAAVMTSWDFTKRTIENMRIFNGKSKTLWVIYELFYDY